MPWAWRLGGTGGRGQGNGEDDMGQGVLGSHFANAPRSLASVDSATSVSSGGAAPSTSLASTALGKKKPPPPVALPAHSGIGGAAGSSSHRPHSLSPSHAAAVPKTSPLSPMTSPTPRGATTPRIGVSTPKVCTRPKSILILVDGLIRKQFSACELARVRGVVKRHNDCRTFDTRWVLGPPTHRERGRQRGQACATRMTMESHVSLGRGCTCVNELVAVFNGLSPPISVLLPD